ncbi:uncharacterized protein [Rutidosis leptorrhynchoides]|uniref:uncharacterized protein isoform X2 n=1 Tax=Rutidosis leptorrhynchoides TaxID=125765 RepID=UPI003A995A6D
MMQMVYDCMLKLSRDELPVEHTSPESRPLRELLGHTPPQAVEGTRIAGALRIICVDFHGNQFEPGRVVVKVRSALHVLKRVIFSYILMQNVLRSVTQSKLRVDKPNIHAGGSTGSFNHFRPYMLICIG